MITFEFHPDKSQSNHEKHGIDFKTAEQLWKDEQLLEIPARSTDEPRCLVIGKIDGRHWSAIITHRPPNIRIISVRRARESEVNLYESQVTG